MHSAYLFCAGFVVSCFVCFGIVASGAVFVSINNRLVKKKEEE